MSKIGIKIILLPLLLASAVLLSSCYSIGHAGGFGPYGAIVTIATQGTSGTQVGGSKEGQACAMTILGLIGTGDARISDAANDAGIKKITSVDVDRLTVTPLFNRTCTVVHGD